MPMLSSASSKMVGLDPKLYVPIRGAMLGNEIPVNVSRLAVWLNGWS